MTEISENLKKWIIEEAKRSYDRGATDFGEALLEGFKEMQNILKEVNSDSIKISEVIFMIEASIKDIDKF